MTVLLTLTADAKAGELRFVTLSCSVGLQLASNAPTGGAVYVIRPRQDAAGPYCGGLLGGSLELTRPVGGGQRLVMTVTKGNSKIQVNNLVPASGTR
jgi:hypothetical protein